MLQHVQKTCPFFSALLCLCTTIKPVKVFIPVKTSSIRPLDVNRDMLAVAALIEECFASTLDPDGREYLYHIRRAVEDPALIRWVWTTDEEVSSPLFGYVWEEDGRIVGNLTLIPARKDKEWVYIIANVAVHPDYRRRGIARQLTLRALDHLRQHHIRSAWLQVREDNPAAHHLYLSVGFAERSRRALWLSSLPGVRPPHVPGVRVTGRRWRDWKCQREWLQRTYPSDVRWNLSLSISRFNANPFYQFVQWMMGSNQRHWVARGVGADRKPWGFLSWEHLTSYIQMLWAATNPAHEEEALMALLPRAQQELAHLHLPLGVNYPASKAEAAFQACGFHLHSVLIWMEYRLEGE